MTLVGRDLMLTYVQIVVTPLTRRDWTKGVFQYNLANETAKALAVANSTGSRFIDLNKRSSDYVVAIGQTVIHRSPLFHPQSDFSVSR